MKIKIISVAIVLLLLIMVVWLVVFPNAKPTPPPVTNDATFPVAESLQHPDPQKTFDTLLATPPRPVFKTVLDNMHLDVFGVLPCAAKPSESVIMLTAKYSTDKPINTFTAAVDAVTAWEAFIPADLGPLLYPTAKTVQSTAKNGFVSSKVNNPNIVSTYEKSLTVSVDGTPGAIYYAWTLNYVFFATSQVCLESAMSAVYSGD